MQKSLEKYGYGKSEIVHLSFSKDTASGETILFLPTNSLLIEMRFEIVEPWSSANATLSVGDDTNPSAFVPSGEVILSAPVGIVYEMSIHRMMTKPTHVRLFLQHFSSVTGKANLSIIANN